MVAWIDPTAFWKGTPEEPQTCAQVWRFKNEREAMAKLEHLQNTQRGWGWMGHVKMEGSSKAIQCPECGALGHAASDCDMEG